VPRSYLALDRDPVAPRQVRRIQAVARELLRLGAMRRARQLLLSLGPDDLVEIDRADE
jgi:hypothetical protein